MLYLKRLKCYIYVSEDIDVNKTSASIVYGKTWLGN